LPMQNRFSLGEPAQPVRHAFRSRILPGGENGCTLSRYRVLPNQGL